MKKSFDYKKLILFVLPLLLSACFIYLLVWLGFFSSITYLVLAFVTSATAIAQFWLIKSSKAQQLIIILKNVIVLIVSGFLTFMYLIVGPSGNDGLLIGLQILLIVTTLSTIPSLLIERKALLSKR